jgi:hypothetical protein
VLNAGGVVFAAAVYFSAAAWTTGHTLHCLLRYSIRRFAAQSVVGDFRAAGATAAAEARA